MMPFKPLPWDSSPSPLIPAHSGQHPCWLFRWVLKGDVIRLPGWSHVQSLGPRQCALCHGMFAWWWREQASLTLAWTRPLKHPDSASVTYRTWKRVPSSSRMEGGGRSSHLVTPIVFSHPSSSCPLPVHFPPLLAEAVPPNPVGKFFLLLFFCFVLWCVHVSLLGIHQYHLFCRTSSTCVTVPTLST